MTVCKESWSEEAFAALRMWAKTNASWYDPPPRTIEWVRAHSVYCETVTAPGDSRWWGPVVQRALREKIIRRKGFAPAKSSHGALKARYVGTRHA